MPPKTRRLVGSRVTARRIKEHVFSGPAYAVSTTETPVPQDLHHVCPRCGGDPAGAVWCPRCGLNLRAHARAGDQPTPPDGPDPEPPRRRLPLILGLAAAAVVAVVLVVVLTGGKDGGPSVEPPWHATPTASVTSTPPPATPTASPVAPTVDTATMHRILTEYVDAYGAEDLQRLAGLFSPDLVRMNGSDPDQDHADALDTYATQFQALTNPRYTLSDLEYTEGRGTGSASGIYRITSDSGSVSTGGIAFDFTERGGTVLIDVIATEPLS